MARSDLLLTLVRAGMAGDRALLRATVEAMAVEERASRHTALADKLSKAILVNGHHAATHGHVNGSGSPGREFLAETTPARTLDELALTDVARRQVADLVEEQHRADLLRSHGLQPRHRVLLSGPPGNGKTALAEAMAEALAVPFLSVRYDTLIGSYLGETTQRLRKLFDYVRTTPCLLLFDEFDAVGKERGDVHETGEIKRVVSSLLLQIDALPSTVVVVAATNHAELLDRAVWRRFQVRLAMPAPSRAEIARFLSRAFATLPEHRALNAGKAADLLWPVSYAETTEFLIDLRRRHVLSLGEKRFVDIMAEQLALWSARSKVEAHGERSEQTPVEVRSALPCPADKGIGEIIALSSQVSPGAPAKGAGAKARRPRKGAGKRR
jgi:SpoVK/Ycf46/Vps4 family AAA+-type ATPase